MKTAIPVEEVARSHPRRRDLDGRWLHGRGLASPPHRRAGRVRAARMADPDRQRHRRFPAWAWASSSRAAPSDARHHFTRSVSSPETQKKMIRRRDRRPSFVPRGTLAAHEAVAAAAAVVGGRRPADRWQVGVCSAARSRTDPLARATGLDRLRRTCAQCWSGSAPCSTSDGRCACSPDWHGAKPARDDSEPLVDAVDLGAGDGCEPRHRQVGPAAAVVGPARPHAAVGDVARPRRGPRRDAVAASSRTSHRRCMGLLRPRPAADREERVPGMRRQRPRARAPRRRRDAPSAKGAPKIVRARAAADGARFVTAASSGRRIVRRRVRTTGSARRCRWSTAARLSSLADRAQLAFARRRPAQAVDAARFRAPGRGAQCRRTGDAEPGRFGRRAHRWVRWSTGVRRASGERSSSSSTTTRRCAARSRT